MSDATHAPSDDLRLRHLIEAYCNQVASSEEFAELEQRLSTDAAARHFYLRYMNLESALESYGDNAAGAWNSDSRHASEPVRHTWFPPRLTAIAIACGIAAVAVLAWLWPGEGAREQPLPIIAVLEQLNGSVVVAGSDGHVRSAGSGAQVKAGDTVRTQETQSAATLAYPDGTRLSLVGETSVTCHSSEQKIVTVHGGTLYASVAAQPTGHPMRIVTLTDSLEILGTRFTLDATAAETDLSVKEGRVRLTRLRDGESVEVPAGQRVVSSARSALALNDIPPTPGEWSVDFEDGLPTDWGSGKLVLTDLPSGSRAGVQSVRMPSKDGAPVEIATADQWTRGLFAVHDDSHLHFICKMHSPGWLNILISTRTPDGDPPMFAGNYIYDEDDWRPHQADRWVRVSIPLRSFRPLPPARGSFEDAVPYRILFSSLDGDRGLVIDHIAVTRGGPGRVVTKELP